jgi:hypothetical protein
VGRPFFLFLKVLTSKIRLTIFISHLTTHLPSRWLLEIVYSSIYSHVIVIQHKYSSSFLEPLFYAMCSSILYLYVSFGFYLLSLFSSCTFLDSKLLLLFRFCRHIEYFSIFTSSIFQCPVLYCFIFVFVSSIPPSLVSTPVVLPLLFLRSNISNVCCLTLT